MQLPKQSGTEPGSCCPETRHDAEAAFDVFVTAHGARSDKAVDKLVKDRDVLLTFYGFPARHWKHIRTTNPIERVRAGP